MAKNKVNLKSRKVAIIISYLVILVNTFSNLILTPLYLRFLGMEQYGLYQMVYSVAHYLLILDFGISTTMVRYISGYHMKNDYDSEQNFSAHCLTIVIILITAVIGIGVAVNTHLEGIYPSITLNEAPIAHSSFILMIAAIAATILTHFFEGVIMSYEQFVIVKAVSLIKLCLKLILTISSLLLGLGIIGIVLVDLLVTLCSLIAYAIYSFGKLKFKIVFGQFDKQLIISILTFMLAILLQAIVQYVNSVVDKTILGIKTTKTDVAIYSIAMTFITLFNSLPSAITGVFLPQAVKLVNTTEDRDELTAFVVRPGRYQFVICSGILAGFVILGKDFISIWAGKDSLLAWTIALIIMTPNMIPLIENAALSILDAKKKRMFRSVVLLIISVINVGLTLVLVSKVGAIGAPIGTALAFIVGYGIIMNIYYERVIGLKVLKLFKMVISRIWVCVLVASGVTIAFKYLVPCKTLIHLLLNMTVFCVVYFGALLKFGFNHVERADVRAILSKVPFLRKLLLKK